MTWKVIEMVFVIYGVTHEQWLYAKPDRLYRARTKPNYSMSYPRQTVAQVAPAWPHPQKC